MLSMQSVVQALVQSEGQQGVLVLDKDGRILHSSGELENAQNTANAILRILHNTRGALESLQNPCALHTVNVTFERCKFVVALYQELVYVLQKVQGE